MGETQPSGDPGWGPALRMGLLLLPLLPVLPFVGRWMTRRGSSRWDGLTLLRLLYLAYVGALLLILVVLFPVLGGEEPEGDNLLPWVGFLVAFALASLGGVWWAHRRPLEAAHAADAYRTLFFLKTAFGQSSALMGFVLVFVTGRLWFYLVGLGFSAIGLALAAPTAGDIQRRQAKLSAAGASVSLEEELSAARPFGKPSAS